MGRRPRVHFAGAVYHVMARGVEGRDIFIDDHDRTSFLESLSRFTSDAAADMLAYCLMGNHFHLAIQINAVPLSSLMHRLLTRHAKALNTRLGRRGHLFEARHKAIICHDERYLATLVRYIHLNPVRAGIVSRPQDWPWSSIKAWPGTETDSCPEDFDPWHGMSNETVDMKRRLDVSKYGLDEIASRISLSSGFSLEELRSKGRHRRVVAARRALTREAIQNGHALNSIAAWLNITKSSVTRYCHSNIATTGMPGTNI